MSIHRISNTIDQALTAAGLDTRTGTVKTVMETIRNALEAARIAQDPRASHMVTAQVALENSLSDRQLLADYEQQQQRIYELEVSGKPIEPNDKRKLADLHGKVVGSPVIKQVLKAQADFLEVMNSVSQRIEQEALARVGGAGKDKDEN